MKDSKKTSGIIPSIAKSMGERSVTTRCIWWFNQPKVPEGMKKAVTSKK